MSVQVSHHCDYEAQTLDSLILISSPTHPACPDFLHHLLSLLKYSSPKYPYLFIVVYSCLCIQTNREYKYFDAFSHLSNNKPSHPRVLQRQIQ